MFQLRNSHIRGCWGTKPGLGSEMVVTGDRWPASVPLTDTSFRRHPKQFFGFDQIFKTRWKLENKIMNIIYRIYIYIYIDRKTVLGKTFVNWLRGFIIWSKCELWKTFIFAEKQLWPFVTDMLCILYTWKTVWTFFCCPWVLPVMDVFFVQLRILVFDCEGLFKSFDNTVFGHPPTVSKRGISIQSGANWESWSGTQIWPQILPYFPPNLDVPIKYQYFFNIMLEKKQ